MDNQFENSKLIDSNELETLNPNQTSTTVESEKISKECKYLYQNFQMKELLMKIDYKFL